jgi:hypothetical protein
VYSQRTAPPGRLWVVSRPYLKHPGGCSAAQGPYAREQMPGMGPLAKSPALFSQWAIIVGFADIILRLKELNHGIR